MTAAEQAWIDESLARLEELHEQREHVEATGQMDRLAEIDEEIASLTEVLETVADASGPINVAANAPIAVAQMPMAPQGGTQPHAPVAAPMGVAVQQPAFGTAPQPVPAPQPEYAQPGYAPAVTAPAPAVAGPGMTAPQTPYAGPGATAPNPAVAAAPTAMPAPMQMTDYSDLGDDLEYKSSKLPLIIGAAVLVVGGAVGAFFAFGGKDEPPPAPTQPVETKVITAAEVQEDNSDLDVAKGADVDRTPGREVKESSAPEQPRRNGGGGNNRRSSSKKDKKGDGRTLDLGKSRDPLSGV